MGILREILAPAPLTKVRGFAPQDDYWYNQVGVKSLTGIAINPETALSISTVFRCVSAIAQDLAGMPLITYRQTDQGKERATDHYLYDVLHDQPNAWQTSFEWREMLMGHLLLRGNAYCLIQEGPRGFADQLIPLNPARMKVTQLPNRHLIYDYTWETLRTERYTQDEIFHLKGLSSDGILGLSVVTLARQSMGLGLATEEYGARFFSQDASPGGILIVEGTLDDDASKRLERSWAQGHAGRQNAHNVAVLEGGTKWEQVGLSNEDAQFLATRNFQIEEMARWFGVPLHRIGHTEKATSWGTGIEQFNLGYIAYTLFPWLKRWEHSIQKTLILEESRAVFVEFLIDHLLRGDTAARYTAYGAAIKDGWMNRNEVREKENMNQVPGLSEYLVPQNMATIDEDGNVVPVNQDQGQAAPAPALQEATQRAVDIRPLMLAYDAASRVTRREIAAKRREVRREENDPAMVETFWTEHVAFIVEGLHLSERIAEKYVEATKSLSLADLEATEEHRNTELAALALEGGLSSTLMHRTVTTRRWVRDETGRDAETTLETVS